MKRSVKRIEFGAHGALGNPRRGLRQTAKSLVGLGAAIRESAVQGFVRGQSGVFRSIRHSCVAEVFFLHQNLVKIPHRHFRKMFSRLPSYRQWNHTTFISSEM